ncbi:hypothetical protein JCM3765_006075 [Sporobolomyces pararoseus]
MPPRASTSKQQQQSNQSSSSSSSLPIFRQSLQLEKALSQNLPSHCSASSSSRRGEREGGGLMRFQKMSGKGRTRREELEAEEAEGFEEEQDEEQDEDEEEEEEEEDEEEGVIGDLQVGRKKSSRKGSTTATKEKAKSGTTKSNGKEREKNLNKRNSGSVGRRKISMSYIEEKARRTVTFTKRKSGLMKKAFELSTLTGTDCLVVVVSESGLVYTFATPSLKGVTESQRGKQVISLALKGELTADDGEVDGDQRDRDSTTPVEKPQGKKRGKERERSGSAIASATTQLIPTTTNNDNNLEDLYAGMIDPSLSSSATNSHSHHSLSPFHHPTSISSNSFPFPSPSDSHHWPLPLPPPNQSTTSHHHQLPIPPLSISLEDTSHHYPFFSFSTNHQTPSSSTALPPPPMVSTTSSSPNPIYQTDLSIPPPPPSSSNAATGSTGGVPLSLPSLNFPTTFPVPPPSSTSSSTDPQTGLNHESRQQGGMKVIREGEREREEDQSSSFARATKSHQSAFEKFQSGVSSNGGWNPNKIPPVTPLPLQEEEIELEMEMEDDLRRRAEFGEDGGGGEGEAEPPQRKKRKLGAKDFGHEAREWQDRIIDRAAGSSSLEKHPTLIGNPNTKESLEDRRKFWKDRAKESISNSRKSPTISRFLHSYFLSTVASSTLPPSIPKLDSETGEMIGEIEGLPKPGPAAVTHGILKQFVESNRGLESESFTSVLDWFLLEQEEKFGTHSFRIGSIKQHLVEFFDFLEGHGLIDEDQYLEGISFGADQRGEGKRRGLVLKEKYEN